MEKTIDDQIQIFRCVLCQAFHQESYMPCPDCGATRQFQEKVTDENARTAFEIQAVGRSRKALRGVSDDALRVMLVWLKAALKENEYRDCNT